MVDRERAEKKGVVLWNPAWHQTTRRSGLAVTLILRYGNPQNGASNAVFTVSVNRANGLKLPNYDLSAGGETEGDRFR